MRGNKRKGKREMEQEKGEEGKSWRRREKKIGGKETRKMRGQERMI